MNRAERRRNERGHVIGSQWAKHPSPQQLKQGSGWLRDMKQVYRKGNEYVVMTRELETDWGTITHATITTYQDTDIPWAEKQQIKNELFGPDAQAVEVYPKESELVDGANMYHLWLLPGDMELPFHLKKEKDIL